MERLTLADFEHQAHEFDAAVDQASGIDPFCSRSDWILPANAAFSPGRHAFIYTAPCGWIAFMQRSVGRTSYLEPLEAMWGMGSPLITNTQELVVRFRELLTNHTNVNAAIIPGIFDHSPLWQRAATVLASRFHVATGPVATRHIASLRGGLDGFLSRRSRNFRKNMRKAYRRAKDAGIRFAPCSLTSAATTKGVVARIMRVETASWKGHLGVGVDQGSMREFYERMLVRLIARKSARLWFATHNGRDVAYVLGGVCGRRYRGLQFSFDQAFTAYSLGNLCQYHQIIELCEQGCTVYDLGMGMDYKQHWADDTCNSTCLIVKRA